MKTIKEIFSNNSLVLAPMEDVSDSTFRLLCKKFGADVVVTEFASSDALCRKVEKTQQKIKFSEQERPIGIQIFGSDMMAMVEAARIAEQACPDFIDINWGCPIKKIVVKGAGAAMLKDIPKMIAITKAVVNSVSIPVTVKTRIGWEEKNKPIVEVALRLQDVGIQALTIHGRTRSQLYSGNADWTLIGEVKSHPNIQIPIIGNGDIIDGKTAKYRFNQTKVDAVMIGRASIGSPWIFSQVKHFLKTGEEQEMPSIDERIEVFLTHLLATINEKGERKAILEMRKHYSNYFKGIPHFKQYKLALMNSMHFNDVRDVIMKFQNSYPQ